MFLLRTDFMEEYRTVEKEASDFFIEKKSKFIGYAKPVSTPDEAADFINTIKAMHWDATHNMFCVTTIFRDTAMTASRRVLPVFPCLMFC